MRSFGLLLFSLVVLRFPAETERKREKKTQRGVGERGRKKEKKEGNIRAREKKKKKLNNGDGGARLCRHGDGASVRMARGLFPVGL